MKLEKQLKELYASRWEGLSGALGAIAESGAAVKPAYPFLLSLARWDGGEAREDWYAGADMRVMVFGQETNSWSGEMDDFGVPPSPVFNPEVSMEAVMGVYENFYATYYHDGHFTYSGGRYGTFFYGVNRLAELIAARHPSKRTAFLWNNIVKVGKAVGSGFCGEGIYAAAKEQFPVIREEVKILQPDAILFLTGSYDERIREALGSVEFTPLSGLSVEETARVILPGIGIPAFRTWHPSARQPKEKKEECYQVIAASL